MDRAPSLAPVKVTLFRDLPSEGWPSMARYAAELEAALVRQGCEARSFAPALPWRRLPGRLNAWANYAWRTLAYPRAAAGQQGEVNHILDHSYAHLIRALDPARTVVTCHDVAPLAAGPGRGLAGRLWRRSFAAMQSAAWIITASEFTRAELLKHAPYPANRILVIPYGVSPQFRQSASVAAVAALREQHAPEGRALILHVGSCEPRKNVEAILRALPPLRDLKAVFAQVGGQFSPAQLALVDELGIRADCVQTGPVSETGLAAWYHAADLLVFPSLYEGFGLPVLEAMACGLPVACANAAALPEVAGGAARLFDPHQPEALAAAVRSILTEAGLRPSLVERGRRRSAEFTWDETARSTREVYEEVAAGARSAG